MADEAMIRLQLIDLNLEIAAGGDARSALEALMARGHSRQSAVEVLLHGKVMCEAEAEFVLPNRWPEVCVALGEGRSVKELFPSGLRSKPEGKGN
jgi:hypothetical protein